MSTQVNSRVVWISRDDLVEQFNLINSRLGVMSGGPYDLQGNVLPRLCVPRKPHCGEIPPSELPCNDIAPVLERLVNAHWMITTFAVIFGILLFCCNLGAVIT